MYSGVPIVIVFKNLSSPEHLGSVVKISLKGSFLSDQAVRLVAQPIVTIISHAPVAVRLLSHLISSAVMYVLTVFLLSVLHEHHMHPL